MNENLDDLIAAGVPEEIVKAARELGASSAGAAPSLDKLKADASTPVLGDDPTPRPPGL